MSLNRLDPTRPGYAFREVPGCKRAVEVAPSKYTAAGERPTAIDFALLANDRAVVVNTGDDGRSVFATGTLKWDGCCDYNTVDEDRISYQHHRCGFDDHEADLAAWRVAYDLMVEITGGD